MAAHFEVRITGFQFDQKDITVVIGDTVTWINEDGTSHSVTADPGSQLPITEIVLDESPAYSSRINFATAGKLSYHCKFHTTMKGSVTVAAATK